LLGLATFFLAVNLLVRGALSIWMWQQLSFLEIVLALLMGVAFDLATLAFFALPWLLYLSVAPYRFQQGRWHRVAVRALALFSIGLLLFVALAEVVFWEEFGVRFNFIAVDYLVYTHEVIGNIEQSYPIGWMLLGLALLTYGLYRLTRRLWTPEPNVALGWRARLALLGSTLALTLLNAMILSGQSLQLSSNSYADQIGRNGIYQFFAAFRNAELDYAKFYPQLPLSSEQLVAHLKPLLANDDSEFAQSDSIVRWVVPEGEAKPWNVVMISVESLSADFMTEFGNTKGITPNLDRLAKEGLFFSDLYATGNRTVRGLEALSLAVPPTPGESIVKRPENGGLFTLGHVLKERGYRSMFVYGGYSYFDNMKEFFAGNDYQVIDRLALNNTEIDHETIWGVADENLFSLALRNMEQSYASRQPFFAHIMTVSNHRPYSYPEGRVDIPSGTGRDGAVKYTDWAIGDFIERARARPWFDQTVFLIVADHCASSAGKVDLPIARYHIPALIYAPKLVAPQRFERLASQIDLVPTLLGLMNVPYQSQFFGQDLLRLAPGRERAFIATYQSLGYLRDGVLTVLAPNQPIVQQRPSADGSTAEPLAVPREDLKTEAMLYFQGASSLYRSGQMRIAARVPPRSDKALAQE